MVNAFRYGFLGVSDVPVASAFTLMTLLTMLLFGTAVVSLNRGVGIRE
jgi:ABC-2 type transport system permease protein